MFGLFNNGDDDVTNTGSPTSIFNKDGFSLRYQLYLKCFLCFYSNVYEKIKSKRIFKIYIIS